MTLRELIPLLQLSIGPVILLSGIGLLLLSMTNRFGRIIDRSRILAAQLRSGADLELARAQVRVLTRRASLVRRAIFLAAVSVLLVATLIITLFLAAILELEPVGAVIVQFVCAMLSLIGSLICFILDIDLSLAALRLDLGEKPE